MIKVKYKVLYKNGVEDEIIQEAAEEVLVKINNLIYEAFSEEAEGVLTFGDSTSNGYYIRLNDISRVAIEIL